MNLKNNDNFILEVRALELRYNHNVVLSDISFAVNPGSCLVIMGASGCGKSTLLKSMTGLLKPTLGNIRFIGGELWGGGEVPNQDLLSNFGVLFQGGALWGSMNLLNLYLYPWRRLLL